MLSKYMTVLKEFGSGTSKLIWIIQFFRDKARPFWKNSRGQCPQDTVIIFAKLSLSHSSP
jgi:hypothetical protein